MLKKLRITLAVIFSLLITLLFLDFTGALHAWFGWMAKLQFLPALLASNFIVVAAIVVTTLIFGRVYCSIICPLGVYQDGVSWIGEKIRKNHFRYRKNRKWLRYSIAIVFAVLLFLGLNWIAILIAPYSIYGRIASNIFAPVYQSINNIFAYFAERWGSYAFYHVDVYIKSLPIFIISLVYFIGITLSGMFFGRGYCNNICPVGTVLGVFSKYSLLKPHINAEKCKSCGLCEKNCRCSAIDSESKTIDYSKCVTCFNCIGKCNRGAISYRLVKSEKLKVKREDGGEIKDEGSTSRKMFLATIAGLATVSAVKAQEKIVDGGLAIIEDKKAPKRNTPLKPAGSQSLKNFTSSCTGCQLCVQSCENHVLRPSTKLENLMQPEMSYERGYCRPECTACSEVCPAGAIRKVSREEKSSIQIGHAVFIAKNCVSFNGEAECGNCARRCPSGAITMMHSDSDDESSPMVPIVNQERCIGCGACEHVCPARPFSAIYVEGNEVHRTI
ncbi:MAG: 4Fe-4S dicluster domain-containing protein [Bacteroidales bacterium]|nr:4Fe-4S dicluster domain-containing protein [Bacteroidales bacterium]